MMMMMMTTMTLVMTVCNLHIFAFCAICVHKEPVDYFFCRATFAEFCRQYRMWLLESAALILPIYANDWTMHWTIAAKFI